MIMNELEDLPLVLFYTCVLCDFECFFHIKVKKSPSAAPGYLAQEFAAAVFKL
jgi:hypothetical protein